MRRSREIRLGQVLLAGTFISLCIAAFALPTTFAGDAVKIDPQADSVLREFSDVLKELDHFRLKFNVYLRAKSGSRRGGKTFCDYDVAVQRPDRIALTPKNKKDHIAVVSDGENLHINLPMSSQHVVMPAPVSLAGAVDLGKLSMFDADLSLADPLHILLADDPYAHMLEGVREVLYVGEEKFTGTKCHRIRMMTEEGQVDYWFKARGKPMLVRIVPDPPPPLPVMRFGMGGTANAADNELSYTFKKWKIKRKIPGRVFTFKTSKVSEEVDFDTAMGSISSGDKPLLGEKAPTFKLALHDGGKMDLKSHIGKDVVILDFWASWCGPCRMGMPIIEEVAGKYKDKGVVFYAVNLREDKSTVEGYLKSTGLDLTVAMDKKGSVAGKYGVGGIPHTVIIGKDGKVRDVHIGFSPSLGEELTAMLNKLIAE